MRDTMRTATSISSRVSKEVKMLVGGNLPFPLVHDSHPFLAILPNFLTILSLPPASLQARCSLQGLVMVLPMTRPWPTAMSTTPLWPPLESSTLAGDWASTRAVLAGSWTIASVTPSISPGPSVAQGGLGYTRSMPIPTRLPTQPWMPDMMPTASEVKSKLTLNSISSDSFDSKMSSLIWFNFTSYSGHLTSGQ